MIVKTIPSTWLVEEEHRLDCGPFVKGGIEARKIIENLRYRKDHLVDLTKDGINGIYHVGQDKIIWAKDEYHGMPFLRSSDILKADLTNQPFISRKQVAGNLLFQCPEGTTLITRSGTIGRMSYMRKDMEDTAISQDVLKVVPNTEKVKSGYLYAMLNSKYGIPIVVGGTFGSIIVHIEAENIADLPVPRLGMVEDQAHDLVQQAADLLCKYQLNIKNATKSYFESVGLNDISGEHWRNWGDDLGFEINLSSPTSLRALNFNPRYQRIINKIKSVSWKTLEDICEPESIKRGGRFIRIDGDPEFSYLMVGQKQIFWLRPEGRWIAKKFLSEDLIVNPGTTLIAAVGTLEDSEKYCRSEFIWGKGAERAYSEHFYQVLPKDDVMPSGCLFAFIRSEMAFRMLRSISYGTKLQVQRPDFLRDLPIPYPEDKEARYAIHKLVVEAYEAKDKAIAFEDQARTLVEHAIEEGGR